jgi:hypothetical protein
MTPIDAVSMPEIRDCRRILDRRIGERNYIQGEFIQASVDAGTLQDLCLELEEAQRVIQTVAQMTQKELEFHISSLVSLALAAVFDDPYEFIVEFVQRRGRTECDLWFVRSPQGNGTVEKGNGPGGAVEKGNGPGGAVEKGNGDKVKIDPMTASGGGAVEVASFALRVALWSMATPRTRNVLLLDEPLKFLKGDILPERGSRMIQLLSERLNLQIIMVSHIADQIEGADRRIEVKLKDGRSRVKIL